MAMVKSGFCLILLSIFLSGCLNKSDPNEKPIDSEEIITEIESADTDTTSTDTILTDNQDTSIVTKTFSNLIESG